MTADVPLPRELGDALQALVVEPNASIRDAMQAIDRGTHEIALVVDAEGQLRGTVSDGDVRRALLRGDVLDAPLANCMHTTPQTVSPSSRRAEVLDLMQARSLAQIPIVDSDGRLLGLHVLRQLLGAVERPNAAVIMAGGRGTRLGALTKEIPKPMLPVAGRPILERLVLHLVGSGIRRIRISVNYLAHVIEEHFGDGSQFGCQIGYLREEPDNPLGTGGSLTMLRAADHRGQPFVVMNADLITSFAVGDLLDAHVLSGCPVTIGLGRYEHAVPFGVVESKGGRLREMVEKPTAAWRINAGVYAVDPSLLDRIPEGIMYPLPSLIEDCLSRGEEVNVWEIQQDWQDIGQPHELKRARGGQ